MQEINLNTMDFLSVFNKIINDGEKSNDGYQLAGITASNDYDGYTCYLVYKDLTLTLLFHGKYSFDFTKKETLQDFVVKMKRLLAEMKKS